MAGAGIMGRGRRVRRFRNTRRRGIGRSRRDGDCEIASECYGLSGKIACQYAEENF